MCAQSLCRVQLFATPWTVSYQVPLSMEFPSQEYEGELPFPPPGDLPDPGIEPGFNHVAGRFFTIWVARKAPNQGFDPTLQGRFLTTGPPGKSRK